MKILSPSTVVINVQLPLDSLGGYTRLSGRPSLDVRDKNQVYCE